jgi:hypothetical protein
LLSIRQPTLVFITTNRLSWRKRCVNALQVTTSARRAPTMLLAISPDRRRSVCQNCLPCPEDVFFSVQHSAKILFVSVLMPRRAGLRAGRSPRLPACSSAPPIGIDDKRDDRTSSAGDRWTEWSVNHHCNNDRNSSVVNCVYACIYATRPLPAPPQAGGASFNLRRARASAVRAKNQHRGSLRPTSLIVLL